MSGIRSDPLDESTPVVGRMRAPRQAVGPTFCSDFFRSLFTLTNIRGALVTMTHKVATRGLVDENIPTAEIAGATNALLRREDGSLLADQFDGAGGARPAHHHALPRRADRHRVQGPRRLRPHRQCHPARHARRRPHTCRRRQGHTRFVRGRCGAQSRRHPVPAGRLGQGLHRSGRQRPQPQHNRRPTWVASIVRPSTLVNSANFGPASASARVPRAHGDTQTNRSMRCRPPGPPDRFRR